MEGFEKNEVTMVYVKIIHSMYDEAKRNIIHVSSKIEDFTVKVSVLQGSVFIFADNE